MAKNKDKLPDGQLQRSLTSNQMQMIALGGTIGVGLFMGSTSTIKWTVLYIHARRLASYLVMRACEMIITHNRSSADYANSTYFAACWVSYKMEVVFRHREVLPLRRPGAYSVDMRVSYLTLANPYGTTEFISLMIVVTITLMLQMVI